jgi:hypothetical protein
MEWEESRFNARTVVHI